MNLPAVALSLGSNLGDPAAALRDTLNILKNDRAIIVEKISKTYHTEPSGCPPQPPFLNRVVLGKSGLLPTELLGYCLNLERSLGRKRSVPKGPRIIDIDILFYGNSVIDSPALTLPHPAIPERPSILVPMIEVCPEWIHPVTGLNAEDMLSFYNKGNLRGIFRQ